MGRVLLLLAPILHILFSHALGWAKLGRHHNSGDLILDEVPVFEDFLPHLYVLALMRHSLTPYVDCSLQVN